jgi:hypothetical protein
MGQTCALQARREGSIPSGSTAEFHQPEPTAPCYGAEKVSEWLGGPPASRPHRLAARITDFQSVDRGSIPRGGTGNALLCKVEFFDNSVKAKMSTCGAGILSWTQPARPPGKPEFDGKRKW